MPWAPKHPCATPGCPALVKPGQPRCPGHTRQHEQQDRARRGNSTARGYDEQWRQLRAEYARAHPWCEACALDGLRVAVAIVDHRQPIRRGGARLDPRNLESLCRSHHGKKTARDG